MSRRAVIRLHAGPAVESRLMDSLSSLDAPFFPLGKCNNGHATTEMQREQLCLSVPLFIVKLCYTFGCCACCATPKVVAIREGRRGPEWMVSYPCPLLPAFAGAARNLLQMHSCRNFVHARLALSTCSPHPRCCLILFFPERGDFTSRKTGCPRRSRPSGCWASPTRGVGQPGGTFVGPSTPFRMERIVGTLNGNPKFGVISPGCFLFLFGGRIVGGALLQ